ncbi:Ankyrin repeat-containing protein [Rhynchospora pubera]|uniref:Ankyrin repeat-containing protein n=1 Tax=Rhynchospora pubera TaxID=906938 RepID=A0AAV8CF40_9POAL|nr:Ankyrin repeat-containing protein [Rhynchospora pubera]
MDLLNGNESFTKKKMTKQLTGKRDDTFLHHAARAGNLQEIREIVLGASSDMALKEILVAQNQSGETGLYVAAECGHVELVREMLQYHDASTAGIKAKNGYDALLISAKQGDVEVVRELLDAIPQLAMTVDQYNTTALHLAGTQGHTEMVQFLLEADPGLVLIARSNGKTVLHSSARNGHVDVVRALLDREPGVATRTDKKGQTALHMAVKGTSVDSVNELIRVDPKLLNSADSKGNTPLHIAARKGRGQIVKTLLDAPGADWKILNRAGETALDTAEKMGHSSITAFLTERGVQSAKILSPPNNSSPQQTLKQQVRTIKHEVHYQLETARQTRRQVQGIATRLKKLHIAGLNNAINSSTVVAVLIATVAFAAIFTVPGQYVTSDNLIPGYQIGEANISHNMAFIIFFVMDSLALFISLAVVVVQTSVVVIESRAKKQMVAIVNKLMWLACVFISVAFLALSFIVVGKDEQWLAVTVTIIGGTILAGTLGTMIYWVVSHRLESRRIRSIRRNSFQNRSNSNSAYSCITETEFLDQEFKKMYAV